MRKLSFRLEDSVNQIPRRGYVQTIASALLVLSLFSTATSVNAVDLLSPFKKMFNKEEEGIIWQDKDEFVKLVEQDWGRKHRRAPVNSHPVNLNPNNIAVVLESLRTWGPKKTSAEGKMVAIFTPEKISLLSGKLAQALSQAGLEQDAVFAVADTYQDLGNSGRRATGGRVFVHEGDLNIIFGDILSPAPEGKKQNTSHYSKPHRAGKRMESLGRAFRVASGPGIGFWKEKGSQREDWVVIDIPILSPGLPVAAEKNTQIPTPASSKLQENWQMREEMARLRKELEDSKNRQAAEEPAGIEPARATVPAPPARTETAEKSTMIEQRLSTLRSLHEKKLITDEEYEAKRKEILAEI